MKKNKITPHKLKIEELIQHFDVDVNQGLSDKEASKRLNKYGKNVLKEKKQKSLLQLIIEQFRGAIIYLLLAAVVVSFAFGEIPEAIAIIVVIVLNTAIGFGMEYQARSSMKALKKLDKLNADVLRNGNRIEIDAEGLVPGDILFLEEGNLIAADCRIIEQNELKMNESALTGESVPVSKKADVLDKNVPLADRINMVFKGTSVSMGNGKSLVVSTGMETGIGDISEMVSREDRNKTPLNIKLNSLSKQLVWIVLGLAVIYGFVGYLTGQELLLMIQTAIAWAIAAIPEGLAIVATIALAKGMYRLSKENVIVKKLAAVETLGQTTIILTDKTGTLTENKLSVEQIYIDNYDAKLKDIKFDKQKDNEIFRKLIKVAALCNNAHFDKEDNIKGDTVEKALLIFIESLNKNMFRDIHNKYKKQDEDPFDSESKFMATMHQKDSNYIYSLKGASGEVMKRCKKVITDSGQENFSDDLINKWKEKDNELSSGGLKTLAFAYKESKNKESLEQDYVFIGIIGFLDPPRKDIKKAVQNCKDAGIRVVMITGDHPETSKNIALQIGIIEEEDSAVFAGNEIDDYKESDPSKLSKSNIFARVDPGQKLDVLNIFKRSGNIVGMTGDGVNDAPALKMADIGIAMGKRGSQVAKEYAEMVLKNDNFPSILTAIKQGRIIFSNIRKFVIYQLSYHLSEIIVIAAVSFSVFKLPLFPLQLLFLNLLVDVFPALALAFSKGIPDIMKQKPKNPEEPILTKKSWMIISSYGVIMAMWVIAAYFFSLFYMEVSDEIANNIAFFSLSFMQLLHVFNMRDYDEHPFNNQITQNKYVWYAISFCAIVIIAVYFIPGINDLLSFQPMGIKPWLLVVGTIFSSFISIQLLKSFNVIK